MQTLQYTFIDKTDWERGPWDQEPDKVQWPDKKTGLPALAVRNPNLGHWCGYVGVGPKHPLFKIEYEVIEPDIEVHGGVTYSEFCVEEDKEHGVCHRPDPGEEDNVWWFGFDCCHSQDLSPGLLLAFRQIGLSRAIKRHLALGKYRDLEYVKNQCAHLARQFSEK